MELQNNYQDFESRGVEILAISTDSLEDTAGIVAGIGIEFPVLYNTEGDVPRAYGVFNHFGDGLATGSVFLVDLDGNVAWKSIYSGVYDLITSAEILAAIDAS